MAESGTGCQELSSRTGENLPWVMQGRLGKDEHNSYPGFKRGGVKGISIISLIPLSGKMLARVNGLKAPSEIKSKPAMDILNFSRSSWVYPV